MYHKIHWYANIILYQVYTRTALKKRETSKKQLNN